MARFHELSWTNPVRPLGMSNGSDGVWRPPILKLILFLLLVAAFSCDSSLAPPLVTESAVVCDVFDQRCLPCEAAGEGEVCEVGGASGICTVMRPIQGPQVLVEGLRCRPE